MDWLRQLPIGQYVDDGSSWLRQLDPRLKLLWTLAFLVTPILAGPWWRLGLVVLLLLITLVSGLPWRLWGRSLGILLVLAVLVGGLAALLPTTEGPVLLPQRSPTELRLTPAPLPADRPPRSGLSWEVLRLGPWRPLPSLPSLGPVVVTRRAAELGLSSATLVVTLIHSANLLLLTTPPEELVWAISWCLHPLGRWGWPVERLGFTLLLALRFLPLVQEELQNLLRALATRAVNLRALGWRTALALVLALGERLLASVLLRAEQGAEALLARGGHWLPPDQLHTPRTGRDPGSWWAALALLLLLALRGTLGGL